MLAPVVLGLAFFIFSLIYGLIAVNKTQLPSEFDKIPLEIANYEIKQIDPITNEIKWILRANKSEASSAEDEAKIIDPHLVYYKNSQPSFYIKSKFAHLESQKQEVQMFDGVKLISADKRFVIESGALFFQDSRKEILVDKSWTLSIDNGYKVFGDSGVIDRDFGHIVSKGHAQLRKDDPKDPMLLSAGNIVVDVKGKNLTVQANTDASLNLLEDHLLKAQNITINDDSTVVARDQVSVATSKLSCYSAKMHVVVDAAKKPQQAIFEGAPYAIQKGKKIFADVIIYDFNTEELVLEGRVHSQSI